MLKRMSSVLAVVLLTLVSVQNVQGQIGRKAGPGGDPRVAKLLDQIGWKYEVDKDGDFKLLFNLENDRTHLVYVMSKTEKLRGLEIREVWAPGFRVGEDPDPEVLLHLLKENARKKAGAWRVIGTGDRQMAVFAVQIEAEADAETMKTIVTAVIETADQLEKEVTDADEF